MAKKSNYYLIAVSLKKNLDLCMRYGITGFTNSVNGAWAFFDIDIGDFVTFIYGARAFNLYKVSKKVAIENAEALPPWDIIEFKRSGRKYYFPFRFELELVREFNEPIVRYEFAYIAENLLLRGGYRKTHFQADLTTLQNVSSMGVKSGMKTEKIKYPSITEFSPMITFKRSEVDIPITYKFIELFLQSIIKHKISNRQNFLKFLKIINSCSDFNQTDFEILSEKALPQGHVDLLVKEAVPIGTSKQIVIEVKTGKASYKDLLQLVSYVEEIGEECVGGVLIAKDFQKKVMQNRGDINLIKYNFSDVDKDKYRFWELVNKLQLQNFISKEVLR
jgi:hypothetical protein